MGDVTWDSLDPDELIVCHYDSTHCLLRKKLQAHLLKEVSPCGFVLTCCDTWVDTLGEYDQSVVLFMKDTEHGFGDETRYDVCFECTSYVQNQKIIALLHLSRCVFSRVTFLGRYMYVLVFFLCVSIRAILWGFSKWSLGASPFAWGEGLVQMLYPHCFCVQNVDTTNQIRVWCIACISRLSTFTLPFVLLISTLCSLISSHFSCGP